MEHKRRRRRRRINPRFLIFIAVLALIALLLVCLILQRNGDNSPSSTTSSESSGSTESSKKPFFSFPTQPTDTSTEPEGPQNHWEEQDGSRYYLFADGTKATGWQDIDGSRYYFDADGVMQTGWLEENGQRYYLKEDGSMARGKVEIDGQARYFTSFGTHILLANPWNYIPEDYEPDLITLDLSISVEGSKVDRSCYDALLKMIADCNKECPQVCVVSSYRTMQHQTNSFNNKVKYYMNQGYSEEDAKAEAGTIIAKPGTSEHQLGLAVDIVDTRLWSLIEEQADQPAQKWLMENSWKYGFILRYPNDKTDVTGIIYEPWHYRYVGLEVAKELRDSGMVLEEYLDSLTTE